MNLEAVIDSAAMKRIPKTMAVKFNLVMIRDEDDRIVAYTDKINNDKQLYLNFIFAREIKFKKGERKAILSMIKTYYDNRQVDLLNGNFIEKRLDKILEDAVKSSSSDIHIEPYRDFANIRFRINGELILIERISISDYLSLVNRIKVLSAMDIANKLEPQDGKMTVCLDENNYDVRVSSIPTTNGEKLVLRVLYKDVNLNNIEKLNFSDKQRKTLEKLIGLKRGIIIINGPTGSGKSTTLYACLNSLDKQKLNISTVEDPVEFEIPMVIQSNVNEKIGFSFSKALKYILRQDPDVILVGEVRDEETAKMAIRAAVTGHKVFSTIHTSTGREVYYRLLNMGVDQYLIDDALVGVITQRLIKVLCDDCKEKIDKREFKKLNLYGIKELYRHKGCEKCNYTGYKGRTIVAEVVDLVNKDKTFIDNYKWGKEMYESINELLKDGKISIEDYLLFKNGELLID
ncbi:GspE/PulE family protein [Clostridium mediterraneense]|uniref:GspE/PulE family protein n=1 Tax=Clostridium mediterraneense TaxID=1805472 RepID=UPI000A035912|nr:GspE/PulE family protein [Clostridium mediterraneense]